MILAGDNEQRYAKAGPAAAFIEVPGEDGTWTTVGSWNAADDPTYAHILAGATGNNQWDLPALHDVTIELDEVVTQTFRVTITESFDADRLLADARFTALAQVYVTSTDPDPSAGELVVPETGQVGRQLRVDATGFVPNERVTFTVGGQPVETIARERYADEDGVFAGYVFVPASHATGQDVTVTGVGQSSGRSYSATTTLVVPDTFAKIESAVASSTHEPSKVVSNTFDGSRTTAWWSKQGDFPTNRPTVTYTLDKPASISEVILAGDNEQRYAKAGPAAAFIEVPGEDGTWTTVGSWNAADDPTYAHILAGATGNNQWDLPALHDVTIELDEVVTQTFRVTITESFDADRLLADARFTALAQVYVTSTDPGSPPA